MFKAENLPTWLCVAVALWQVVQQNIWRRQDLKQAPVVSHTIRFWLSNAVLISCIVFAALWNTSVNPIPHETRSVLIELLIVLGLLAVGVILGISSRPRSESLPQTDKSQPQQWKTKAQKLQWAHADRDRLSREIERLKKRAQIDCDLSKVNLALPLATALRDDIDRMKNNGALLAHPLGSSVESLVSQRQVIAGAYLEAVLFRERFKAVHSFVTSLELQIHDPVVKDEIRFLPGVPSELDRENLRKETDAFVTALRVHSRSLKDELEKQSDS